MYLEFLINNKQPNQSLSCAPNQLNKQTMTFNSKSFTSPIRIIDERIKTEIYQMEPCLGLELPSIIKELVTLIISKQNIKVFIRQTRIRDE